MSILHAAGCDNRDNGDRTGEDSVTRSLEDITESDSNDEWDDDQWFEFDDYQDWQMGESNEISAADVHPPPECRIDGLNTLPLVPGSALTGYPSAPLDSANLEIRLLELHPANYYQDPVRLSMTRHSLGDRPQYNALSYTWGVSTFGHTISLNGRDHAVTDNLAAALRRLRQRDQQRLMWIDALCINQLDLIERSQQVAIMAEIYKTASNVLVWLGDSNEPWATSAPISRRSVFSTYDNFLEEDHKQRSLSFAMTNTYPRWWTRAWVLQEAVVSRAEPLFIFGPHCTTLECLSDILKRGELDQVHFAELLPRLSFITQLRSRYFAGEVTMLDALEAARDTHATDLRDRIFSLHGFLPRRAQNLLRPDYTASYRTVFETALMVLTFETGNFIGLTALSANTSRIFVGESTGLPQWIESMCCNPTQTMREFRDGTLWNMLTRPRYSAERSWTGIPIPAIQAAHQTNGKATLACSAVLLDRVETWLMLEEDTAYISTEIRSSLIGALSRLVRTSLSIEEFRAGLRGQSMFFQPFPFMRFYLAEWNPEMVFYHKARPEWVLERLKSMQSLCSQAVKLLGEFMPLIASSPSSKDVLSTEGLEERAARADTDDSSSVRRDDESIAPCLSTSLEYPCLNRSFYSGPTRDVMRQCKKCQGMGGQDARDIPATSTADMYGSSRNLKDVLQGMSSSVFSTESGFLGLAPQQVMQGDTVAYIDETYVPAIIRQKDGCFKFVCYCYVPSMRGANCTELPSSDLIIDGFVGPRD